MSRHPHEPDTAPPLAEKDGEEARPKGPSHDTPTDGLVIIPLRNAVLFPGVVTPLSIGRKGSLLAVEDATRHEVPIGMLAQRDATTDEPARADLHVIGCIADVLRIMVSPEGQPVLVVRGRQRFRVKDFAQLEPFLRANVELLDEQVPASPEFEARVLHLRQLWVKLLALLPQSVPELAAVMEGLQDPSQLVDVIASSLDLPVAGHQELLETTDLDERVRKVTERLQRQIEVLELTRKIDTETKESLDKSQRDFYLRQQLKTIQRQLGDEDGRAAEARELRRKVAKAAMPAEVEEQAKREIDRLERTPEGSLDGSMTRNYVDWLVELPWGVETEERIDLDKARERLDHDHHDLEMVKKRIIEFLAVRKLKPEGRSPILCFVGPPGVGKTSLGQSIAGAMNRNFVRQSLGGVHDEADIRGHRRTYVGALPGRIIQGLRKAGSRNPVFMLDEVDKLSASFHGDPAAALLEVLDPEQNSTFEDHYLGLPFDLSRVLFIATANVIDMIPAPLRDRTEVIELPGYGEEDKLAIARQYLVTRQLDANGLAGSAVAFDDESLQEIIRGYTRESGVRQLEREIAAVCRDIATRFAEGRIEAVKVDGAFVLATLGKPRFRSEVALRTSMPGVATGLAWTPFGGDILFVEATRMSGKGALLLTGQLGDVMKESAQAALSLLRSRATELGIDEEIFPKSDIHVHIPAGAIPKDGPSAGVTLFVALVSLLTGRRVRTDVAMTGEISLRGLVLPVGGVKEKVLAARRAGIRRIVLPELNRRDLDEVPESTRRELEPIWVTKVEEVLDCVLEAAHEKLDRRALQRGGELPRSAGTDPVAAHTRTP